MALGTYVSLLAWIPWLKVAAIIGAVVISIAVGARWVDWTHEKSEDALLGR